MDIIQNEIETEHVLTSNEIPSYLMGSFAPNPIKDIRPEQAPSKIQLDFARPMLAEANRRLATLQADPQTQNKELGFTFEYVLETQAVTNTDVIVGSADYSMQHESRKLDGSSVPILKVHSHPVDSLFSGIDYADTLLTVNDERLQRGVLLITPQQQILALATTETPKYDVSKFEQTQSMLKDLNIEKYQHAVGEASKQHKSALAQKLGEFTRRMGGNILQQITAAIPGTRSNRAINKLENDIDTMTANKKDNVAKKAQNITDIEIAREMGVVLYSSTDCLNFTKWSA